MLVKATLCGSVTAHGHGDTKNKSATGEVGLGANVRNREAGSTCARSLSVAGFDITAKGNLGREGLTIPTTVHPWEKQRQGLMKGGVEQRPWRNTAYPGLLSLSPYTIQEHLPQWLDPPTHQSRQYPQAFLLANILAYSHLMLPLPIGP